MSNRKCGRIMYNCTYIIRIKTSHKLIMDREEWVRTYSTVSCIEGTELLQEYLSMVRYQFIQYLVLFDSVKTGESCKPFTRQERDVHWQSNGCEEVVDGISGNGCSLQTIYSLYRHLREITHNIHIHACTIYTVHVGLLE